MIEVKGKESWERRKLERERKGVEIGKIRNKRRRTHGMRTGRDEDNRETEKEGRERMEQ